MISFSVTSQEEWPQMTQMVRRFPQINSIEIESAQICFICVICDCSCSLPITDRAFVTPL